MAGQKVLFGFGPGSAVVKSDDIVRCAIHADRAGLDVLTISDHPYYGQRLDAYAALAFILGRTADISGAVTVTNVPARPAPMLARGITSLAALSGGRVVFGVGAGGYWDEIVKLGVARLTPAAAVRAMEEAITVVRALSGGGAPVTFDGEFYQVHGIDPAPVPAPPVWTGSVGPKSLAVTGRLADGWVPGRAADWLRPDYIASRRLVDAAAEAAGRDPAEVATIFNLPGQITAAPLAATRDRLTRRWVGGSPAQWIEELTTAVLDHGAAGFIYFITDDTPSDVALGRWAEEVVPAVREAIAKS
jgi:alkanesulfonate monooxygenase SsuD/methylene tetrahydromethanopterin reductase-like flavin-dependent oxidoreductase (luciferase family)